MPKELKDKLFRSERIRKEINELEYEQEQIEDDFAYELEKAISKILKLSWVDVFLAGMDENITGLDMFNQQNVFDIVTNITTAHKLDYTVVKVK